MAEPFLGEIRLFAFGTIPSGWAPCNGQVLNVQTNQALFTLISNRYGGDGKSTFALPNLQGRVPMALAPSDTLGTVGGEALHVLTINEMPTHTHEASGGSDGTISSATGSAWGTLAGNTAYASTTNTVMASAALSTAGASQGHPNMQPYLALNFCIALSGIWPPRG